MTTNPRAEGKAIVDNAIRMMARHVLALAIERQDVSDLWEDLPDIAEDDWARIVRLVDDTAEAHDSATPEQFAAAYALLQARAEQ